MTPKLQEESKLARAEEDSMRSRKATAARAAAEVAAQETACRLAVHLDELHEQLAQLRVQVGRGGGAAVHASYRMVCVSIIPV